MNVGREFGSFLEASARVCFKGSIDEVAAWNRMLSEWEIQTLFWIDGENPMLDIAFGAPADWLVRAACSGRSGPR